MKRTWSIPNEKSKTALGFSKLLGISEQVAGVLYQRGIRSCREALEFLKPTLLSLVSPFQFRDMQKAVRRLDEARINGEKVLVYGDYDVDGVTSTALLYKVLIDMGFTAVAYIPNRQDEGYGVNREAVEKAAAAGVKVIITVDCGITAVSEAALAASLGIDLVITDHHEPSGEIPAVYAILNPKEDAGYPFRDLAGVGVVFKLVQALYETLGDKAGTRHCELELLDLVALGTIADVVPLVGENRIFVSYGLHQMENTVHLGLEALLMECGLAGKPLKAGQIAFIVAPRINAAGRMDSARSGLELLLTGRPERAVELAKQLTRENILRQETEKKILAEAMDQLGGPLPRVIVLSSPNWHAGVIGIVASRLVERFYRPVFLIEENGEEAKGSARGISGYHVLESLSKQRELLTKFGGHKQAAGFSLPTKSIPALRERLNLAAANLPEEVFTEVISVDMEISLAELSKQLQQELELMSPYGFGNPGPLMAARCLPVYDVRQMGKEGEHLKVRFGSEGEWEAVAFQLGRRFENFVGCRQADAVFSLEINSYRDRERLQLVVRDLDKEAAIHIRAAQSGVPGTGTGQEKPMDAIGAHEVKILDWRKLSRNEWLERLKDQMDVVIVDISLNNLKEMFLNSLTDAAGELSGSAESQPLHITRNTIGVMVGIPPSWSALKRGYGYVKRLGVHTIILTEFTKKIPESAVRGIEYVSREELIGIFRELRQESKLTNPFSYKLDDESFPQRQALKIFEELGLIKVLGGVGQVVIEFKEVNQKLDLEASWRYRSAKVQFEKMLEFREYLTRLDFLTLMDVIQGVKEDIGMDERG